jgi:glycosyltransferase involved in cell wall biosynthesis
MGNPAVAVVIPSYKVTKHILGVISEIGKEVQAIYVVDDACPQGSGKLVQEQCKDKRVKVIFHDKNQGVGGAVVTGYKAALAEGYDVIVKLDGDGQMDPTDIPTLIRPILEGRADYAKGNRFDSIEDLEAMPAIRIFGNAVLSIMSKISSGYWNVTDPTNGYTAIHSSALKKVQLDKLRKTYFFESDLLFRLSLIRAVVHDVVLPARYGEEVSNLRISKVIFEFPVRHTANFLKRIFYLYYLREWTVSSVELPAGLVLFFFGLIFGVQRWMDSNATGVPATAGSVMLSVTPMILGFQLLLAFVNYDVSSVPNRPRQLEG